ncbi:MAG: VWA domain-containing protein [Planctomycetota bacterium]|nr:VWA domain-containing protein [Planctomycetota bacterium]
MIDWEFLHPEWGRLLWAAAGILIFLAWRQTQGREVLGRFLDAPMLRRLTRRPSRLWRGTELLLAGVASLLAILVLMRPQTPAATEVTWAREASAEVMVLLDVSRSMLAEDAAPNRLERAKAELRDLARSLVGHRIGLTVFAGHAAVVCPLTPDHGFFHLVLDSVGPDTVSRGGSRIGDAIRRAVRGFPTGPGAKLILLVTDGEDHDSYPVEAAKAALEQGIRIVAIGFGDEGGSEIPIVDAETGARTTLKDRLGNVVRSRLDGETLREIALTTEGAYVPAGVGVLDLEPIVSKHIAPLLRDTEPAVTRAVRAERYQGLLLGALVALLGGTLLGAEGSRRSAS